MTSSQLTYKGRNGSRVLYLQDTLGVVVDEASNSVEEINNANVLVASLAG